MKKLIISCVVSSLLVACTTSSNNIKQQSLIKSTSFEELAKNMEGCTTQFFLQSLGQAEPNARTSTDFDMNFQKTETETKTETQNLMGTTVTIQKDFSCNVRVKSTKKGIITKIIYNSARDCQEILYNQMYSFIQEHSNSCTEL